MKEIHKGDKYPIEEGEYAILIVKGERIPVVGYGQNESCDGCPLWAVGRCVEWVDSTGVCLKRVEEDFV